MARQSEQPGHPDLTGGTQTALHSHPGGTLPSVRVFHSVAQTIPPTTGIPLAFDSEWFDTDALHDNVVNNSRLTVNTGGLYSIWAEVLFSPFLSATYALAFLRLNSGMMVGVDTRAPINNPFIGTMLQVNSLLQLNVGDYLELVIQHDDGADADIVASPRVSPEFAMALIL